jgi:DNA topoisomerase I
MDASQVFLQHIVDDKSYTDLTYFEKKHLFTEQVLTSLADGDVHDINEAFMNTPEKRRLMQQINPHMYDVVDGFIKYVENHGAPVPPKPVWDWWKDMDNIGDVTWTTLQHNGVLFAPPYEAHNIKMKYAGKKVDLSPDEEEVATWYATYLQTDHVKKTQFNINFFKAFRKVLSKKNKKLITDFDDCDFSPINKFLQKRREDKKARPKEEKEKEALQRVSDTSKYGYAMVDGHYQKIGNYKVEIPGLFLGRGDHPLTGTIKPRLTPQDVVLNLSEDAYIPECTVEGERWKDVVCNNNVTWLAFWTVTNEAGKSSYKYVFPAASSKTKGLSDIAKFDKARTLLSKINSIRKSYTKDMSSTMKDVKQLATATWIIDNLALRVGNEKGADEADTVGTCSLRVEHMSFDDETLTVTLDFLGKDSMPYHNSSVVPAAVYKNLKGFVKGKKPNIEIFDLITTTRLNNYLKKLLPGLSAKVFRTFNASVTMEAELNQSKFSKATTVDEKVFFFNKSNKQVAVLCNHQKNVAKTHDATMKKMEQKVKEDKKKLALVTKAYKVFKSGSKPEVEGLRLPVTDEGYKKKIAKMKESIAKQGLKVEDKAENCNIALGTSRINYIDPRIVAAWCKREGVPVEKVFSKALREKFPWAMDVEEDFKF